MADLISVTGRVATPPRSIERREGAALTTFRLATSQSRFDDKTGRWVDGGTNFYTVNAWRGLAETVARSLAKGEQIVLRGKLELRSWRDDHGTDRIDPTIHADSIGHDLRRGSTVLTPLPRPSDDASVTAQVPQQWADGEPLDVPF